MNVDGQRYLIKKKKRAEANLVRSCLKQGRVTVYLIEMLPSSTNAATDDLVASPPRCPASHRPSRRLGRSGRLGCTESAGLSQGTRQCLHI